MIELFMQRVAAPVDSPVGLNGEQFVAFVQLVSQRKELKCIFDK